LFNFGSNSNEQRDSILRLAAKAQASQKLTTRHFIGSFQIFGRGASTLRILKSYRLKLSKKEKEKSI
jgi:hypothetical protein